MARITFHGAAHTVTGSRTLLETADVRLLVDCGLFQGLKELRERNWGDPGFSPQAVDAIVLTHAHIDHSGYLPRLVRDGYSGPIYCTRATRDLCDLLLRDSAKIQEEDAEYANRKGFSKHKPALPLYTEKDAEKAIQKLQVLDYGQWKRIGDDLRFRLRPAGHILGSGIIEMDLEPKKTGSKSQPLRITFSGDVGRYDAPLVPDPTTLEPCDVLILESTYGDRLHPKRRLREEIGDLVRMAIASGGVLLVPSFAVARAQQLIYLFRKAMESHEVPELPIHLDSPMAVNATEIYCKFPEEHGLEEVDMAPGDCILYDRDIFLHRTVNQSKELNGLAGPRVIISSSGMMTGGRILHHLRQRLDDPKNIIVLAGYQAEGTRGRKLKDGAKSLRIHGRDVPVRARVEEMSGLSAHADYAELLRWLEPLKTPPRMTYLNHGEPHAAKALAERLENERNYHCTIPKHQQSFELD